MRLIRLTTEENDGRFDCDFNEDLVIPPNSQIALHSFTTQFPSATIVINTLNNEIRYGVDDSGSKRIILPQGTYSNANIQEFFGQTQQLLNESLAYTQNQVGKQWRAGIFGGKTQFTIKQGIWNTSSSVLTDNNSKNVAFVGTLNPTVILRYQRLGGVMTSNDAFLYFTTPIVKSSGFFTQRVFVDSTSQTNGGFILGLTSNCPNASTTEINPNSLEYGIRFNGVGLPYSEISDGITTETTVLGVLGDTLQLNYALKKMTYTIKRFAGGEVILKEGIFNHMSDYFPVSILNGDCILGETWYIKDPFYNVSETDDNVGLGTDTARFPIPPQFEPTPNFFEFVSGSLAQEFGYINARIPEVGFRSGVNFAYTATNPFVLRDYSDTYVVELLNIQLNSMDAMTKQHKNFLAVVPHLQDLRELVVYVAPILIFLDLNNKFPLSYRQIKARILRDDLTAVTTYGLTQMAILIKSADE